MGFFIVFAGGGLAAAARHGVNLLLARLIGVGFPFGTLAVNVLGSLLMGVIVGYFAFQGEASQNWRLFLTTGILGGWRRSALRSPASSPACRCCAIFRDGFDRASPPVEWRMNGLI
jgi:hypothetical protein